MTYAPRNPRTNTKCEAGHTEDASAPTPTPTPPAEGMNGQVHIILNIPHHGYK